MSDLNNKVVKTLMICMTSKLKTLQGGWVIKDGDVNTEEWWMG